MTIELSLELWQTTTPLIAFLTGMEITPFMTEEATVDKAKAVVDRLKESTDNIEKFLAPYLIQGILVGLKITKPTRLPLPDEIPDKPLAPVEPVDDRMWMLYRDGKIKRTDTWSAIEPAWRDVSLDGVDGKVVMFQIHPIKPKTSVILYTEDGKMYVTDDMDQDKPEWQRIH